jgi:hypothetical protein
MGVLLFSFIKLYSFSFADAENYLRWSLVVLFTDCGVVQNIRIPGMTVQIAAGHYKQTQGAALLEAILNLGVSIALVRFMGIDGVLIGTIVAYLYRSTYVIVYNDHHFLPGTLKRTLLRFVRNIVTFGAISFIGIYYLAPRINSWGSWIILAFILFFSSSVLFLVVNSIFEPDVIKTSIRYIIKRKKKNGHR